jgi:hypothetical protein
MEVFFEVQGFSMKSVIKGKAIEYPIQLSSIRQRKRDETEMSPHKG